MNKITQLEPRISIVTLFVSDIARSYSFYAEGLGFPTKSKPDEPWIGFELKGLLFCLYPYQDTEKENLKREVNPDLALNKKLMPGVGFAYNTRKKHEVHEVLELAQKAGGTIEKEPEETFWGGYSGYFSDPDGHLWEVAWAESWEFKPDGSLTL